DDAIAALPHLARRAYGYVGADLMELAREAGLRALRRASGEFVDRPSLAAAAQSADLVVTADDFDQALRAMRPASLRESLLSYPSTTFADIGGLEDAKRRLRELISGPLQ